MRHGILSLIVRRSGHALLVLAALSVIIFAAMRAIPGDPVLTILGENETTAEQYQQLSKALGLDQPMYMQYLHWIGGVLRGDFGNSIQTQQPVLPLIIEKLGATLELALLAVIIGAVVGILAGILAAMKRDTALDSMSAIASLMGISVPVFWFGLILIILFSVKWNLTPTGGMMSFDTLIDPITGFPLVDAILAGDWNGFKDLVVHAILPVVTLSVTPAALIARTTRSSMIEVINEDYAKAGLARGLTTWQVLRRHVLKNAMIPVVTVIGLEIGVYLGGSIVVETMFSWPGLGREVINAIELHDYPVIQGAVLVYAVLVVLVNLIVDVIYMVADPRIRM